MGFGKSDGGGSSSDSINARRIRVQSGSGGGSRIFASPASPATPPASPERGTAAENPATATLAADTATDTATDTGTRTAADVTKTPTTSFILKPTAAPPGDVQRIEFQGKTGELYRVMLRNLVLNVLTLGIYQAWAKTHLRRYLWSRMSFAGDPLEYTGTGREFFRGLMMGGAVLTLFSMFSQGLSFAVGTVFPPTSPQAILIGMTVNVLFFIFIMPMARYGGQRYRFSRTTWRGIRLGVRGSARNYAFYCMGQSLLTLLTLGFYHPFATNNARARLVRDTTVGGTHLEYDGNGKDLLRPWLLTTVLMIPTLGLIWFWYGLRAHRYMMEHTSLNGVRFTSDMTYRNWSSLFTGNFLLLLCTLGLAWPAVVRRDMSFACAHNGITGDPGFEAIVQGARQEAGTGEGIAEVMDVGNMGFG